MIYLILIIASFNSKSSNDYPQSRCDFSIVIGMDTFDLCGSIDDLIDCFKEPDSIEIILDEMDGGYLKSFYYKNIIFEFWSENLEFSNFYYLHGVYILSGEICLLYDRNQFCETVGTNIENSQFFRFLHFSSGFGVSKYSLIMSNEYDTINYFMKGNAIEKIVIKELYD